AKDRELGSWHLVDPRDLGVRGEDKSVELGDELVTFGDGQADANVGRRSRALIGHHPYVAELAHVYGSKLLGCSSGNRYRPYLSSKRKYAHDSPPVEILGVSFLPALSLQRSRADLHTDISSLSMRSCPYCETGSMIVTAVAEAGDSLITTDPHLLGVS